MSVVRNPFARRDEKIVSIKDIPPEERGLNCRCTCPVCGSRFIARIGDVRRAHFAHDGKPCDLTRLVMTSLYELLQKALEEKSEFTYPSCYGLFLGVNLQYKASMKQIKDAVNWSEYDPQDSDYDEIIRGKSFPVGQVSLQLGRKDIPEALVLQDRTGKHSLAVVIVPPATLCKIPEPSAYRKMSTVAIYMRDDWDDTPSAKIKERLRDECTEKVWVESPKINEWLNKCMEKQHKYHEERKKEQLQKYQATKQQQKLENQKFMAEIPYNFIGTTEDRGSTIRMQYRSIDGLPESELEEIANELAKLYVELPDKIVCERGIRWCRCERCLRWNPEARMTFRGGSDRNVNSGICRICAYKQSET